MLVGSYRQTRQPQVLAVVSVSSVARRKSTRMQSSCTRKQQTPFACKSKVNPTRLSLLHHDLPKQAKQVEEEGVKRGKDEKKRNKSHYPNSNTPSRQRSRSSIRARRLSPIRQTQRTRRRSKYPHRGFQSLPPGRTRGCGARARPGHRTLHSQGQLPTGGDTQAEFGRTVRSHAGRQQEGAGVV